MQYFEIRNKPRLIYGQNRCDGLDDYACPNPTYLDNMCVSVGQIVEGNTQSAPTNEEREREQRYTENTH